MFCNLFSCIQDIDECYENSHSCEQVCINRLGSYNCSCNEGFVLASDMRSCVPSVVGTSALSGSFQSQGGQSIIRWISAVNGSLTWTKKRLHHCLVIDDSAYGIFSVHNCRTDYLAFYDGLTTDAPSLGKFCFIRAPLTG